jgi:hypothetical protein
MDLLSGLKESMWKNASPKDLKDMKHYIIVRSKPLQQAGKFEIDIREDVEDGTMQPAILEGVSGKTNPLQHVRNCLLKVKGEKIIAINLDDDCVVRK